MLDLTFIRSNPDVVKEAARVKNNPIDIDALLTVDQQVLTFQRQIEEARALQNKLSKRVQEAARNKDNELRAALIAESKQLGEQIKAMEPELEALQEEFRLLREQASSKLELIEASKKTRLNASQPNGVR